MRKNVTEIDGSGLMAWAKAHPDSATKIAASIGKCASYFTAICADGRISTPAYKLLLRTYNLPAGSFLPRAEKPAETSAGWSASLTVNPERVRMAILFDGSEETIGYSAVHGDTEVDLLRAISYATHQCFANIEQRELARK